MLFKCEYCLQTLSGRDILYMCNCEFNHGVCNECGKDTTISRIRGEKFRDKYHGLWENRFGWNNNVLNFDLFKKQERSSWYLNSTEDISNHLYTYIIGHIRPVKDGELKITIDGETRIKNLKGGEIYTINLWRTLILYNLFSLQFSSDFEYQLMDLFSISSNERYLLTYAKSFLPGLGIVIGDGRVKFIN